CLDPARAVHLSTWRWAVGGRTAVVCAGTYGADCDWPGRAARRRAPVHRVEGSSPCLLPLAAARRKRLATWPTPWPALRLLLRRHDGEPAGHRAHGSARNGYRDCRDHRGTCDAGG